MRGLMILLAIVDVFVLLWLVGAEGVRRYQWRLMTMMQRALATGRINNGQYTVLLNDLESARRVEDVRAIELFLSEVLGE